MNWWKLAALSPSWQANWQSELKKAITASFPVAQRGEKPQTPKRTPSMYYPDGIDAHGSAVTAYLSHGDCQYWFNVAPDVRQGWTFYVAAQRISGGNGPREFPTEATFKTPFEVVQHMEKLVLNDRNDWDNDGDAPADPTPAPSTSRSPQLVGV